MGHIKIWVGKVGGDFLGSENISNSLRAKNFINYSEAKKIVKAMNFNSISEFKKAHKLKKMSAKIPSNPNITYKNNGWKGWSDFLGVVIISTNNKKFKSYLEAKSYVQKLGIKSSTMWKLYIKNNLIDDDMPRMPDWTYKAKGDWKGWADFLNKEN